MKDIDFLPEWYKESHRRRTHVHRQYIGLTGIVCAMISYNLVATHRIGAVNAAVDRLDDQRSVAEQVIHQLDSVSRQLSERQTKVHLISQMDSRIDVSAILAELSHIVSGPVVLSQVDIVSETVSTLPGEPGRSSSAVRPAGSSTGKPAPLGDVCFRIVLTGVAAHSGDVGALARRLEESSYFRRVCPVTRAGKIELAASAASSAEPGPIPATATREAFQVSDFEITCTLANTEEIKGG